MLESSYLFIDGGHLRPYYTEAVREWFGNDGEIDFNVLKNHTQAFKLFYYDCLDNVRRSGEKDTDYEERVSKQQAWFDTIRSVVGAHVRLGSLTGKKQSKLRQKEVDILLTVDMMNHAIRQNMKRAVLLTGDRDFKPVVESLVQMGMFVEVIGDARHTSKELTRAADASKLLAFEDYFVYSTNALKSAHQLPNETQIVYRAEGDYEGQLVARGQLNGKVVIISFAGVYRAYVPIPDTNSAYVFSSPSTERLKLYIKLRFGEVQWQQ